MRWRRSGAVVIKVVGLLACAAGFNVGLLFVGRSTLGAGLATVTAFGGMLLVTLAGPFRWSGRRAIEFDRAPDAEVHPVLSQAVETILIAHAKIKSFERGELFSDVFLSQCSQFALEIEAAAVRQTLEMSPKVHTTRSLLACMKGDDGDICRLVHHLDNNEYFFGRHSRDFFERTTDVLSEGRISEVRRLFVDTGSSMSDPRTRRLIGFHKNVRGYDCRVMAVDDFQAVAVDNGFSEEHLDFGVYGDKYVYISNQRPVTVRSGRSDTPKGLFVAAAVEVKRYSELFDDLWSKGTDQPDGVVVDPCASVGELFG